MNIHHNVWTGAFSAVEQAVSVKAMSRFCTALRQQTLIGMPMGSVRQESEPQNAVARRTRA